MLAVVFVVFTNTVSFFLKSLLTNFPNSTTTEWTGRGKNHCCPKVIIPSDGLETLISVSKTASCCFFLNFSRHGQISCPFCVYIIFKLLLPCLCTTTYTYVVCIFLVTQSQCQGLINTGMSEGMKLCRNPEQNFLVSFWKQLAGGQCQRSGRSDEFPLERFGGELQEIKKTLEIVIHVFLMKCTQSSISKLHLTGMTNEVDTKCFL